MEVNDYIIFDVKMMNDHHVDDVRFCRQHGTHFLSGHMGNMTLRDPW